MKAAHSAVPTPGGANLLRVAEGDVIVVSNNASAAIQAYLDAHGLGRYVRRVVARSHDTSPALLKPSPFLVERAIAISGCPADLALFIGDSTSDVAAGHAAGIPVIGYANKPGKRDRLTAAGADVVVDSMEEIVTAVQRAKADQAP